mmetsp:Transcript_28357/g.64262  ORF Transcript_28357/g.64262 Transcript_28357/m.64262 type:complete len:129 (-) Transcript_28357:315-701(-)
MERRRVTSPGGRFQVLERRHAVSSHGLPNGPSTGYGDSEGCLIDPKSQLGGGARRGQGAGGTSAAGERGGREHEERSEVREEERSGGREDEERSGGRRWSYLYLFNRGDSVSSLHQKLTEREEERERT